MRIKLDNDGISMFPIHASYSVNARADVAYFYNIFLRIGSVKEYWIMKREGWDIEEKKNKGKKKKFKRVKNEEKEKRRKIKRRNFN